MSLHYDLSDPNVKQKLAELPERMMYWAESILLKQAQLMKSLAQIYVAVDTGSLRDSIRVERGGEGAMWRQVKVRAGGYVTNPRTGTLVNYALWVELTQPFMLPAFLEVAPTINAMLEAGLVNPPR